MNSPAHDIAERLEALAIGVVGTDIFVSEEPTSPNNCLAVYDTGGSDALSNIELYKPTVQVRVRDLIYKDAYSKQEEARNALILPDSFTVNSTFYLGVWLQSDIISLGRDSNNRYVLTANYRIERGPV